MLQNPSVSQPSIQDLRTRLLEQVLQGGAADDRTQTPGIRFPEPGQTLAIIWSAACRRISGGITH
jgi:hypothetical protein